MRLMEDVWILRLRPGVKVARGLRAAGLGGGIEAHGARDREDIDLT